MNNRTLELAKQAGMGPWGVGNGDNVSDIVEKFAELVARAYGNIVLHYTDVDEGVRVANKHFGIEE